MAGISSRFGWSGMLIFWFFGCFLYIEFRFYKGRKCVSSYCFLLLFFDCLPRWAVYTPGRAPGQGSRPARQANESAISALNQVFISRKLPLSQPTDAADDAATACMLAVVALYWNTAVSHAAWLMVMVE